MEDKFLTDSHQSVHDSRARFLMDSCRNPHDIAIEVCDRLGSLLGNVEFNASGNDIAEIFGRTVIEAVHISLLALEVRGETHSGQRLSGRALTICF